MSSTNNHEADIKNGNWGTPGTNITWDKAQGNRGKQMNPNQQPAASPPLESGTAQSATKSHTK